MTTLHRFDPLEAPQGAFFGRMEQRARERGTRAVRNLDHAEALFCGPPAPPVRASSWPGPLRRNAAYDSDTFGT
jgi:hypothetical protein